MKRKKILDVVCFHIISYTDLYLILDKNPSSFQYQLLEFGTMTKEAAISAQRFLNGLFLRSLISNFYLSMIISNNQPRKQVFRLQLKHISICDSDLLF